MVCARPVSPLGLARTGWEWGRRRRLRRLGERRVVTLCADLREWYFVFITEGAACATLQGSSVLCATEWGLVSALSPERLCLVLVHVLLHVLKAWALLVVSLVHVRVASVCV
jgi:hypothetical protein